MPGGCQYAERAATQIECCNIPGPGIDAEERRDIRRLQPDDHRAGPLCERRVRSDMVPMGMAVRDDQWDRAALVRDQPFGDQPVDGRHDLPAVRAAVDQQHLVAPEQQIEERRLEIAVDRLADDEGIRVEHLDLGGGFRAVGAVDPALGK